MATSWYSAKQMANVKSRLMRLLAENRVTEAQAVQWLTHLKTSGRPAPSILRAIHRRESDARGAVQLSIDCESVADNFIKSTRLTTK
jgi:hypothetical protein